MCVFNYSVSVWARAIAVSVDYEILDISKRINNIHQLKCRDTLETNILQKQAHSCTLSHPIKSCALMYTQRHSLNETLQTRASSDTLQFQTALLHPGLFMADSIHSSNVWLLLLNGGSIIIILVTLLENTLSYATQQWDEGYCGLSRMHWG